MKRALPTLLLCALLPAAAAAHEVGVSRSSWSYDQGQLTATFILARSELNALTAQALEKAVAESVKIPGCTASGSRSHAVEADGLEISLQLDCPDRVSPEVDLSVLLQRLGPSHRHLAEFQGGEAVLMASAPRFVLGPPPERRSTLDFIRMGGEHILQGPDHLLFLLGLILGVRRLRGVVGVASAFTVGHSLTLTVATLGWFIPPGRIVEPLIALSLVWVGVENILRPQPKGRWIVAGAFGLIHGFGFASALRDLRLPQAQLGWALFGFNLGVELGQLLVLVPLVPLLALLRRKELFERYGGKALSGAVALAGAAWFVVRVR